MVVLVNNEDVDEGALAVVNVDTNEDITAGVATQEQVLEI